MTRRTRSKGNKRSIEDTKSGSESNTPQNKSSSDKKRKKNEQSPKVGETSEVNAVSNKSNNSTRSNDSINNNANRIEDKQIEIETVVTPIELAKKRVAEVMQTDQQELADSEIELQAPDNDSLDDDSRVIKPRGKSKTPSSGKGKGSAKKSKTVVHEKNLENVDKPSTSTGVNLDQNANNQMMLELMAELKKVKEQLQSKLSLDADFTNKPDNNSNKAVGEKKGPVLIRSPSDTVVFAPAVLKNTIYNTGVVQELQSQKNRGNNHVDPQENFVDTFREEDIQETQSINTESTFADNLNKFLNSIRVGAQEKQELRLQGSKRRLNFDDDSQPKKNASGDREFSTKQQAQQRIEEAEKFRAEFIKPKGRQELIQNMTIYNLEQVYEFPNKPLLDDDKLVQMTCHIEDNDAEKAHESQFLDLEKLMTKYSKSFNHEEAQRIELVTKDGQAYYVPRDDSKNIHKITGFNSWEKGFRIYMALYAQKHANRLPEMLQYITTIQHASTKYMWDNVAYYDNVFRHWMAKNPNRSWGKTLNHIWNMAMCDPLSINRGGGGQGYEGNNNKKDNKGVCWRFNKGICSGPCRFIHRCTYCQGTSHGAHICFRKNGRVIKIVVQIR